MGPFAVEAAFPLFAITPPERFFNATNEEALEKIVGGFHWQEQGPVSFDAGSRAEGLAMEHQCGHGMADMDTMEVFSRAWDVCLCQDKCNIFRGMCHLKLDESQSPLAYGRVKVVTGTDEYGVKGLLSRMEEDASERFGEGKLNRCIVEKGGHMWLSSRETVWALQSVGWNGMIDICGPAGRILDGYFDYIPALLCEGKHPALAAFLQRKRLWPGYDTLYEMRSDIPILLVCTGPKNSPHRDLEFRLSWSLYEVIMAKNLPLWVRQAFVAFKYVMKKEMTERRGSVERNDGRCMISSYHLKNVFFWTLEEEPAALQSTSSFELFLLLLEKISGYLKSHVCRIPLYFLPDCNLLENIPVSELELAREALKKIKEDPILAILTSPVEPSETYGYVHVTKETMSMEDLGGVAIQVLLPSVQALQNIKGNILFSEEYSHIDHLLALVDNHRHWNYMMHSDTDIGKRAELGITVDRGQFIYLQDFISDKLAEYSNDYTG